MNKEHLSITFRALAFAADSHRHQRRKDKDASPYINHPIALASVLINEAGIDDYEVVSAALLHDTIEDTLTTADDLKAEFGDAVTDIVLEVTDDKTLGKMERKQLQVKHSSQISRKAQLVKLADKICNLRDISDHPPNGWDLGRKQEYFDWAKDVVEGLRGVCPAMESIFDETYEKRPSG